MVKPDAQPLLLLGVCALGALALLSSSVRTWRRTRQIYLQTAEALAMIPEVAGLVPLGHGERTCIYAAALGRQLGLRGKELFLVKEAARLHHVGQIATPGDRFRAAGMAGATILSGPSFLGDVGKILGAVGSSEAVGVPDAVVRVASSLDDLVGQEPSGLGDALVGLLARHEEGVERTAALALAQLANAQPSLARRAAAASATAVARASVSPT